MPTKPSNVVNSLRDKIVNVTWDLSASATNQEFVDFDTDYDVVEVKGVVKHGAAIVGDGSSATLKVGHGAVGSTVSADDDAFVTVTAAPASATAAGVALTFTQTSVKKLPAGAILLITATANGETDTGEVLIQVRLRPHDKARGNSSKRPSAAQSAQ